MEIKKVAVYCASSSSIDGHYFEATAEIGKILAEQNITVQFGGGSKGLMGQLADSVLEHKGRIIGIMPHFMKAVEWDHKGVSEFVFVEDMAIRKQKLIEGVDALIALPGGSGTLEELLEAMTLKRLGKFTKPIIILNHRGYYDPLITMFQRIIEENFMRVEHHDLWTTIEHPKDLLAAIRNSKEWDSDAINFAGL